VTADESSAAGPTAEADMLFSPARNALIREIYPDATTAAVLVRINELPGRTIYDRGRIAIQAAVLGCKKSPAYFAYRAAKATLAPSLDTPIAAAPVPAAIEAPSTFLPAAPAPRQPVPAPMSRMAALVTVSQAIAVNARNADAPPVLMDFDQVAHWAGQRGIRFASWDDLPAVNNRADAIGHPRIARKFTSVGRRT
jgi:hypothetical protein